MRLQDKKNNCYYEFNHQHGCIIRNAKFDAYLGKRIAPKGQPILILVLAFRNYQSISVMAMRDAYKRQLVSPELLRIYSFIETKDNTTGKSSAFCVLEYADGITLDKFINGDFQSCTASTRANLLGAYSEYCNNRLEFAKRLIAELTDAVDILNNNGFSLANLEPSSILITGSGAIKLLDYGIPVGQVNSSKEEIPMLGRMLYFLMTHTELIGQQNRVKPQKIRNIINKAVGKKFADTAAFKDAFDKGNNWWKVILGIILGLAILLLAIFSIVKKCQNKSDDLPYSNYPGYNSINGESSHKQSDSKVLDNGPSTGEPDYGQLNKLRPKKVENIKKQPKQDNRQEIIQTEGKSKEKSNKERKDKNTQESSVKDIVF